MSNNTNTTVATVSCTYTNSKGDTITIELPVTKFSKVSDTIKVGAPAKRFLTSKDACWGDEKDAAFMYRTLSGQFSEALASWAVRKAKGTMSDEALKPFRNNAFNAFKPIITLISAGQVEATHELFDAVVVRGVVKDVDLFGTWNVVGAGAVTIAHLVEKAWASSTDKPILFSAQGWKKVRKYINATKDALDALTNGLELHEAGKIADDDLTKLQKAYDEALEAETTARNENKVNM